ncbi:hypothetical protein KC950_01795 [Candidatus Saccharibacteria bacterium]|nr:hypothetical protein [Candidatus Saccharibacteria bacterium]
MAKNKLELIILFLFIGAFFVWIPRGEIEIIDKGNCNNPACLKYDLYSKKVNVTERGFPLKWTQYSDNQLYNSNHKSYSYIAFDLFLPLLIAAPIFIINSKKETKKRSLIILSLITGLIFIWYPRDAVTVKQESCLGNTCMEIALPSVLVTERGFPIKWITANGERINDGEEASSKNYIFTLIDLSIPIVMASVAIYILNRKKK